MLRQSSRHLILQKLFWNSRGARVVSRVTKFQHKFNTVVRNYSLIDTTNGERWLPSLLPNQPIVIDVGFYDGASVGTILRVRPRSVIIGLDPSSFACQEYRKRFMHDDRVCFEPVGLSNEVGEMPFYDYGDMCNSLTSRKDSNIKPTVYNVSITTLDRFCHERAIDHVDLLRIDAEGFDLHILEGGQEVLSDQRVDIFVFEFASGWSNTRRYLWEAVDLFAGLPYRLFHLFNGFLCPLVYDVTIDSSCTLPAMYVGVSDSRLAVGDIPIRRYAL